MLAARPLRAAIAAIALEIKADQKDAPAIAIVGIQSRGVPLATRLAAVLRKSTGKKIDVGSRGVGSGENQNLRRESRHPARGEVHHRHDLPAHHLRGLVVRGVLAR